MSFDRMKKRISKLEEVLAAIPEDSEEIRLKWLEKKRKKLARRSFNAMIEEATLRIEIARIGLLLMIFDEE